jgi:hypothetical protein
MEKCNFKALRWNPKLIVLNFLGELSITFPK